MRSLEEIWPVFGLRVTVGRLELRAVRDDDIPALVALAEDGIHEPGRMPFAVAWTEAPDLPREMARHYWHIRSTFKPDEWSLELVVRRDGEIVGSQGVSTSRYLVTRTGETGSWLAKRCHGQGIGTLMRQAICTLMFDHLDAEILTSGAFTDNPASLAVSRKVGYEPNGIERRERRPGELAVNQGLLLRPEAMVRPEEEVRVEGVAGLRRLIGLE